MIQEKMHELSHFFFQLLTSRRFLSNPLKYMILCFTTSVVHLFFSIIMCTNGIWILGIYNIAAFIYYIVLGLISSKADDFLKIYALIIVEIEFHSSLATIMLGWDYNFMIYTIAFISGAFYLENTVKLKHKRFSVAITASWFITLCYFAASIICYFTRPYYSYLSNSSLKLYFFFVNNVLGIVTLLSFSILFALEIQYFSRIMLRENSKLGEVANIDPLTNLFNRRGMSAKINKVIDENSKTSSPICLIMSDIDHFKAINDTYGHDMGDEVLETVGQILSQNIREDDFVSRWGGEEFLILINGTRDEAVLTAERIKEHIADHTFSSSKGNFNLTITMGIAEYEKGIQVRTLISLADQKLYYGKEHGRNQIVY